MMELSQIQNICVVLVLIFVILFISFSKSSEKDQSVLLRSMMRQYSSYNLIVNFFISTGPVYSLVRLIRLVIPESRSDKIFCVRGAKFILVMILSSRIESL